MDPISEFYFIRTVYFILIKKGIIKVFMILILMLKKAEWKK